MTPEQIQRAKAIVEYAAVNSLETEEVQLLGWALQHVAAQGKRIAELEAGRVVVPVESHPIGTADSEYFRRELRTILGRIGNADGPWMARYLRRLADVADATPPQKPVAWALLSEDGGGLLSWSSDIDDALTHWGCKKEDLKPLYAHPAIPADRVLGEGEHKTDALLGFRPIETAPKDGSDILLTDGYSCEIAGWGYYNEDSEAGIECGPEVYDWIFANNEISSPKWWRPIDFLNALRSQAGKDGG